MGRGRGHRRGMGGVDADRGVDRTCDMAMGMDGDVDVDVNMDVGRGRGRGRGNGFVDEGVVRGRGRGRGRGRRWDGFQSSFMPGRRGADSASPSGRPPVGTGRSSPGQMGK